MELDDLGPAERFTAGAIGPPGRRHFYIQVVAGGVPHSLAAEKEQVAALGAQGLQILDEHDISSDLAAVTRLVQDGLDIEDPGPDGAEFRVGTITIGLSDSELLTVHILSVDEDSGVSFVIAPEQLRAMALIALDVVAAGRPICRWCRLPMDPDDHECPARN